MSLGFTPLSAGDGCFQAANLPINAYIWYLEAANALHLFLVPLTVNKYYNGKYFSRYDKKSVVTCPMSPSQETIAAVTMEAPASPLCVRLTRLYHPRQLDIRTEQRRQSVEEWWTLKASEATA